MKKEGGDAWLRDIEARQRNIVFPDTLNNETRGWRNLVEGGPPTAVQRLGIAVLLFFVAGGGLGIAYFVSDAFSRSGLVLLALICVLTLAFVGLILLAVRIGIAFAARDNQQNHRAPSGKQRRANNE